MLEREIIKSIERLSEGDIAGKRRIIYRDYQKKRLQEREIIKSLERLPEAEITGKRDNKIERLPEGEVAGKRDF